MRKQLTPWADRPTSFLYLFFVKFSPFIVGVMLAVVMEQVFGLVHTRSDSMALLSAVGVSAIALSAMTLAAILIAHYEGLRLLNQFKAQVWRDDPRTSRITAYDDCAAAARIAADSIKVVSPHFGENGLTNVSPSHDDYLTKGIFVALRRNADGDERRESFEYKRLIQVDSEAALGEIRRSGVLKLVHVSDPALFLHIAYALMFDPLTNMEVKIYAGPVIPSFPSVLLIDRRHVFFSLPTNLSTHSDRPFADTFGGMREPLDPGPVESGALKIDFVFGLLDETTEVASRFGNLFEKLTTGSAAVTRVDIQDFADARLAHKDYAASIEALFTKEQISRMEKVLKSLGGPAGQR